jgi:5-dehydro-2-deoxygluconokinase
VSGAGEQPEQPYEVIATGRIGVDLYPLQSERTLAQVQTFAKSLGGSATNVAVAASRLACRTALISKVGADPFGDYLREELRGFGVDDRWLGVEQTLRTPIVFCELFPPDRFPILFYREPSAPDMQIAADELDLERIASAHVFWTTGTGLSAEPSRGAVLAALHARGTAAAAAATGRETIHDLDYRPSFWESEAEARRWTRQALAHATVAVGNQEEARVATGEDDHRRAASALLELGVHTAIVKRGPQGVYAMTQQGEELEIEPHALEVVNGLGAGDAFGGALCAGLVQGWGLERTLRAANAAGALVASRLQCAPAMPSREELEQMLESTLA